MVSQHEKSHGLAGILRARGVEDPVRVPVAHRRVENDQIVAHLDDQAVVRAADHVLDAGRPLLEPKPGRRSRVVARRVRVEIGADELAPDHPLIRHGTGRGLRRPRLERGGNREPLGGDRRVDLAVGDLDVDDGTAVQLVLPARRHAQAVHRLPVGEHEIVGHVAPDVVVVERADPGRQPRRRIEQDGQRLITRPIVDGGIGDSPDRHGAGGRDAVGVLQHLEGQQRRSAPELALRRGQPQPRHRMGRRIRVQALLGTPVAIDAGDVARIGCHDLAEGERARRRIREVAHPVDARRVRTDVAGQLERRLAGKAHLAARSHRLLGLPLANRPLHRERLDTGEGLSSPHRLDGPSHELLALGLHRRARRHDQ